MPLGASLMLECSRSDVLPDVTNDQVTGQE